MNFSFYAILYIKCWFDPNFTYHWHNYWYNIILHLHIAYINKYTYPIYKKICIYFLKHVQLNQNKYFIYTLETQPKFYYRITYIKIDIKS